MSQHGPLGSTISTIPCGWWSSDNLCLPSPRLSLTTSHSHPLQPPTTRQQCLTSQKQNGTSPPLSSQSLPLIYPQRPPHKTLQAFPLRHPQCRPPPRLRLRYCRARHKYATGAATLLRRPRFPAFLNHAENHTEGPDPTAVLRGCLGAASAAAEAASNVLRPKRSGHGGPAAGIAVCGDCGERGGDHEGRENWLGIFFFPITSCAGDEMLTGDSRDVVYHGRL